MKTYIFILICIITFTVFYISCYPIKESVSETSIIPNNDNINITTSEGLRDYLKKLYFVASRNENEVDDITKSKVDICFKINKMYSYLDPIKNLLDKSEDEMYLTYGAKSQPQIMEQPVGQKPPQPIIGSNFDYYVLIFLATYSKLLEPYATLKIWEQNPEGDKVRINTKCTSGKKEDKEVVKCAKIMMDDITNMLSYFQYQTDKSDMVALGDASDTGVGSVAGGGVGGGSVGLGSIGLGSVGLGKRIGRRRIGRKIRLSLGRRKKR